MISIDRLELLQAKAREYNRRGEWKALHAVLIILERDWEDHHAALAFYTELERVALREEEDA